MKTKLEVYERLVDLCLARGDAAEASEIFGYIEQAKSRSLRDLFADRACAANREDPNQSELVRQIRTLREELNWYYHRVELEQLSRDERSAERLAHLQAQLRSREHAFIRILRDMPQGSRELVGLSDSEAASPDKIRSLLKPGTTLVEYFRTADRILAVVLDANDLTVVPLTTVSRVQDILRLLQFQLSKFQLGPEYVAKAGSALLKATQCASAGALRRAAGAADASGYRPPGVRSARSPALRAISCVARRALVRHRHAHRFVRAERQHLRAVLRAGGGGWRAFVDSRRARRAGSRHSRRSAGGGASASAVGTPCWGIGEPLAALRELGRVSKVVHIATHGYFREDNPLFSGVRLGDSFLTVQDIYDLQLPVDLITLSGCGTGLNVVAAGDELRGLVRGLLAAGARSALLSLWDVHDQSTAEFMTSFYEGLNAGLSKAVALQRAMALLRIAHPHPYFWAPFVLIGADGITG